MMILRLQVSRVFRTLIDRLIHPPPSVRSLADAGNPAHAEWLAAMKDGRLHPPLNVHDAVAWDTYWDNHLRAGTRCTRYPDSPSTTPM